MATHGEKSKASNSRTVSAASTGSTRVPVGAKTAIVTGCPDRCDCLNTAASQCIRRLGWAAIPGCEVPLASRVQRPCHNKSLGYLIIAMHCCLRVAQREATRGVRL